MSRIVVIEDNKTMREGITQTLAKMEHQVTAFSAGEPGIQECQRELVDLVITDYKMHPMDGIQVLETVKQINKDIDVILITAYGTIELAVEAMKRGAADFLTKPFSPEELKIRVNKVLEFREARQESQRLNEENQYLRQQIDIQYNFGEIVGKSVPMVEVFKKIKKVAPTDSSVLIYGESGTGKELVARAIHSQSRRKDGPFVKVNCSALAEGVLESELFGHEKGAFTGAIRRKKGKFELAHRGSIFLDEIGDIPLSTQAKLLRVLQERELDRVGAEETIKVDVRVITATNKDLLKMTKEGSFREDLFYRLNVIPIELPPLRDRKEDIPELAAHFLEKKCAQLGRKRVKIHPRAMELLLNYCWPGNVRELENVLERAIVLCDGDEICVSDLPILTEEIDWGAVLRLPDTQMPLTQTLEELERQLIERALEKAKGIKTRAAQILGIKTSALYYKLEKYRIS